MSASVKDIIAGRKTFFITPDTSIFPESFCEDYLADGYECYFIANEKRISLEHKIDIIVSVFHDVILFFNLDANIPGINWYQFIDTIGKKYNNQVLMGATFVKRQAKDEKAKLEKKYLFDLGLSCGCIQLEYQKKLNFEIIEKVLFANQAMGRRKSVRALGSNGCTFGFRHNNRDYSGVLQDISLSHFSFVFPEGKLDLKDYEKVSDIQFNIKGLHFRSSAIAFMQRKVPTGDILFVFMFNNNSGGNGLDVTTQQILGPRLYELMCDHCKSLLNRLYDAYLKKISETGEAGALIDLDSENLENSNAL